MSLWDEVRKNIVDLYEVTSDKTTEIAKVGSRRWDKFGISRDIERQFSELGSLVYNGLQEGRQDVLQDEAVAVLMSRIGALEEELKNKEAEISRIHQEHRARKAAEAAGHSSAEAGQEDQADDADEYGAPGDVVLKDPVLDRGSGESAILVEPSEEDGGSGEGPEKTGQDRNS